MKSGFFALSGRVAYNAQAFRGMPTNARAIAQTASALVVLALQAAAFPAQADLAISGKATQNVNCVGGVCTATAQKAVLNVTDLTSMLAIGDVNVTTGAGAITITVESPFSWTSTHRLTLDAYQTVSFRAPVVVAGTGAVTITYNDGGTGGDLIFFPGAKLDFWDTKSTLTIDGNSYKLVSDIGTLSGDVAKRSKGSYALVKDYNAGVDGTYTAAPIATKFGGLFEGLGHVISNLNIDVHDAVFVGLFAIVGRSALVRDINLEDANIQARGREMRVGLSLASIMAGWRT